MDLLKEIDDQISNQLSSLDKIVNELKFNEICQGREFEPLIPLQT